MSLYVGSRVRLLIEIHNETVEPHALADPTSLEVRVSPPRERDQVFQWPMDAAVVRDAVGRFHLDYTCAVHGDHNVRIAAFGAVVAVQRSVIKVQP